MSENMERGADGLIEELSAVRAAVIGDAMLDSYHFGRARRLCQEASVPIVALERSLHAPGGAANVAANLKALGAHVEFLAVRGDDAEGERLCESLAQREIATDHLGVQFDRRTLSKSRVLMEAQMVVRFDQGNTEAISPEMEMFLINRLTELFPQIDALVVSDYGYGVLTDRMIEAIARLQRQDPKVIVVDSKRLPAYRDVGVTAVKPNFMETLHLLGIPTGCLEGDRVEALQGMGDRVLEITGAKIAAVTLDTDGALIFEQGRDPYRTYARPVAHSRAAGAGDTFLSALTLGLAAGGSTPETAELAAAATEVVTKKDGTASCSREELREHFAVPDKYFQDRGQLAALMAFYRDQGQRVVFTNGCFDILHRGHVTYLSQAKALGDVLVLGVNTDEGIRRLKGPARPINSLEDRVQVLGALSCVDHIVAFDEETPCELVGLLQPDLFVKGGDYRRDQLPEARIVEGYGGEIRILPFLADRSTTGLIERIQQTEQACARPSSTAVASNFHSMTHAEAKPSAKPR